jgi:hypothetical protein
LPGRSKPRALPTSKLFWVTLRSLSFVLTFDPSRALERYFQLGFSEFAVAWNPFGPASLRHPRCRNSANPTSKAIIHTRFFPDSLKVSGKRQLRAQPGKVRFQNSFVPELIYERLPVTSWRLPTGAASSADTPSATSRCLLSPRYSADFAENKALIAGTLDAPAESMFSEVPRLAVIYSKWLRPKYPDAEGWEIL